MFIAADFFFNFIYVAKTYINLGKIASLYSSDLDLGYIRKYDKLQKKIYLLMISINQITNLMSFKKKQKLRPPPPIITTTDEIFAQMQTHFSKFSGLKTPTKVTAFSSFKRYYEKLYYFINNRKHLRFL